MRNMLDETVSKTTAQDNAIRAREQIENSQGTCHRRPPRLIVAPEKTQVLNARGGLLRLRLMPKS